MELQIEDWLHGKQSDIETKYPEYDFTEICYRFDKPMLETHENPQLLMTRQVQLLDHLRTKYSITKFVDYDPMTIIVPDGHLHLLHYMIQYNLYRSSQVNTYLEYAVEYGRFDIVKCLIEKIPEELFTKGIVTNYNIYWSYRFGYMKIFCYLCYIQNLSNLDIENLNSKDKSWDHLSFKKSWLGDIKQRLDIPCNYQSMISLILNFFDPSPRFIQKILQLSTLDSKEIQNTMILFEPHLIFVTFEYLFYS